MMKDYLLHTRGQEGGEGFPVWNNSHNFLSEVSSSHLKHFKKVPRGILGGSGVGGG